MTIRAGFSMHSSAFTFTACSIMQQSKTDRTPNNHYQKRGRNFQKVHENLLFPSCIFYNSVMYSTVHGKNSTNILLLEWLLSFKKLLFKAHTMFWYCKSKKSIVTTVFQFQMLLLKIHPGSQKIYFKIRMIKSNSDFCSSSAYWEPIYPQTRKQSKGYGKHSQDIHRTELSMPILLLLHCFYIHKSGIYRVLQSKHILHIIRRH